MARAVWSGALSFGLVTVPVGLFAATQDQTVHFHQFQEGTSDRIRNKRVNERTGREVDFDKIVKGYEIADGRYVMVTPRSWSRPSRAGRGPSTSPTLSPPSRSIRSSTSTPTIWPRMVRRR